MTEERLIPVHAEVCKLEGATNIELGESLTFEKNGHSWAVYWSEALGTFALHKDAQLIRAFFKPEGIKEFFSK